MTASGPPQEASPRPATLNGGRRLPAPRVETYDDDERSRRRSDGVLGWALLALTLLLVVLFGTLLTVTTQAASARPRDEANIAPSPAGTEVLALVD